MALPGDEGHALKPPPDGASICSNGAEGLGAWSRSTVAAMLSISAQGSAPADAGVSEGGGGGAVVGTGGGGTTERVGGAGGGAAVGAGDDDAP